MESKPINDPTFKLTALFMKWKEDSLSAFLLYRWTLKNQDDSLLNLAALKTALETKFKDAIDMGDNEQNIIALKDNLWLIFKMNQETFFVVTKKDNKNYTVEASVLVQFLEENLDKSPYWWPSHFANAKECDKWVDDNMSEIESTITNN